MVQDNGGGCSWSDPASRGVTVRAGDKVSFGGRAVPTVPGYAAAVGLSVEEGSRELEELGVYVTVLRADLVLVS